VVKIIYHLMPFFALFGILFALCSFCFSWAQHHIASWLVACYFYFVSIQSELRTCSARPPESTAHNPFLRPFPHPLPLPQLSVVNVVRFHIFMCIWCVGVCVCVELDSYIRICYAIFALKFTYFLW